MNKIKLDFENLLANDETTFNDNLKKMIELHLKLGDILEFTGQNQILDFKDYNEIAVISSTTV